jgi:hypothetical protein
MSVYFTTVALIICAAMVLLVFIFTLCELRSFEPDEARVYRTLKHTALATFFASTVMLTVSQKSGPLMYVITVAMTVWAIKVAVKSSKEPIDE